MDNQNYHFNTMWLENYIKTLLEDNKEEVIAEIDLFLSEQSDGLFDEITYFNISRSFIHNGMWQFLLDRGVAIFVFTLIKTLSKHGVLICDLQTADKSITENKIG